MNPIERLKAQKAEEAAKGLKVAKPISAEPSPQPPIVQPVPQTMAPVSPPKPKEYKYSTPQSESFKIQLNSGEVKAKNGVMVLNEEQNTELCVLLASGRPDIAQNLIYLDVEAAERLAKDHMARHRPQAHQGSSHSSSNVERKDNEVHAVNLDSKEIPEGASHSLAQKIAVNETLSEEDHRAAALRAQGERVVETVDTVAFHADDTGIEINH